MDNRFRAYPIIKHAQTAQFGEKYAGWMGADYFGIGSKSRIIFRNGVAEAMPFLNISGKKKC